MDAQIEQIEQVVQAWAAAERGGDAGRLGELLADDFVGIGPVGFVLGRDAWLSRFAQGLRYERLDLEESFIRGYDGVSLVVARQRAVGEHQGNPTPPDTRVSFTIVRDDGRLRIASIQYSFMALALAPAPAPGAPRTS
jgi:ketosteroid isomerase-like protein